MSGVWNVGGSSAWALLLLVTFLSTHTHVIAWSAPQSPFALRRAHPSSRSIQPRSLPLACVTTQQRTTVDPLNARTQFLRRPRGLCMSVKSVTNQFPVVAALESPQDERFILPLPQHPLLVEGTLENGLRYKILPHAMPAGRFEAHLEVLSGSASEDESQQGMAHLLEHVAYMGSPNRQHLSGTGSRTNAYTDFHHTVFYAACPTVLPDSPHTTHTQQSMLPLALNALHDALTTPVDPARLEKERSAVLSEAAMVNKMDYRVECQILSALHSENRISQRFPIGKEAQIRAWTAQELRRFRDTHYRPDNAVLYVVGDVVVEEVLRAIRARFEDLPKNGLPNYGLSYSEREVERGRERKSEEETEQVKENEKESEREHGESPTKRATPVEQEKKSVSESESERESVAVSLTMRDVHPHFPPLRHHWWCSAPPLRRALPDTMVRAWEREREIVVKEMRERDAAREKMENEKALTTLSLTEKEGETESERDTQRALTGVTRVYQHDLLRSFSLHLLAKHPAERVTTHAALRRALLSRLVLLALQIRLSVLQRQRALCTFVEFTSMAWAREGCGVRALDLHGEASTWKDATTLAVREVARMGRFGLTPSEWERYRAVLRQEARERRGAAAQRAQPEVVEELMHATALGDTLVDEETRCALTLSLLRDSERDNEREKESERLSDKESEKNSERDSESDPLSLALSVPLSLSEANAVARELCEHLSHCEAYAAMPSAVVACTPQRDRHGSTLSLRERDVAAALCAALREPLAPLEDVPVPRTLLSREEMDRKMREMKPRFLERQTETETERKTKRETESEKETKPESESESVRESDSERESEERVVTRTLSNGLRLTLKRSFDEPNKLSMRIYVRGGRLRERNGNADNDDDSDAAKEGAVLLGIRTAEEGGAFPGVSREAAELFCADRNVMVAMDARHDAVVMDIAGSTLCEGERETEGDSEGEGEGDISLSQSSSQSLSQSLFLSQENKTESESGTEGEEYIERHSESGLETESVSGAEGAMQVAHVLLTSFRFEEDALSRAKAALHETVDAIEKNLESLCEEALRASLTHNDTRWLSPSHAALRALSLCDVESAVRVQWRAVRESVEVVIVSDAPVREMERLALRYLGTVPDLSARSHNESVPAGDSVVHRAVSQPVSDVSQPHDSVTQVPLSHISIIQQSQQLSPPHNAVTQPHSAPLPQRRPTSLTVHPLGSARQLSVRLMDNDERAVGLVGGPAPNRRGVFSDGTTLSQRIERAAEREPATALLAKYAERELQEDKERRERELFPVAALLVLKELINRRLFSLVREERQLTYDANCELHDTDSLDGGYYVVSVTSSCDNVQRAIASCKEALLTLRRSLDVFSLHAMQSAVLQRLRVDSVTHAFWLDRLAGAQVLGRNVTLSGSLGALEDTVASLTVRDLQRVIDVLDLDEERMTTCVGVAAPEGAHVQ